MAEEFRAAGDDRYKSARDNFPAYVHGLLDGARGINLHEISEVCRAFLNGLTMVLGEKLFGLYIYGAAAFPDSFAIGDIDFHVILKEELTESERSELYHLHSSLKENFPPLGGELDGYYILLEDTRGRLPPKSQMWHGVTDDSWALHCEHIRAGRCIVLYGPDPTQVYPAMTWDELEKALWGELAYVEEHLGDSPGYCVLNLCRLMYSFATNDVVISKAAAAQWAYDAFPEWRHLIELARKSYTRQATPEDRKCMLLEVNNLFRYAYDRIQQRHEASRL